jgi:hypothetical protein
MVVQPLSGLRHALEELDRVAEARGYVAQPTADSMPGCLAILTATGAQHVYTWTEVEQLVGMRFALEKRLVKTMPFYGAIFAKPAREAFR